MKHKHEGPYYEECNNPRNIGVFSLHPQAGATFFTVLLAEYLSNDIGLKTAVIENSQRSDLLFLQSQAKISSEDETFELHHIRFCCAGSYLKNTSQNFNGFDCYVYDLGSSYAKARDLIQACDITFLLFTMTPWHCDPVKLLKLLSKDYGEKNHLCLIGNQIPHELKKQLYKQLRCEFIGFEPNLFKPSCEAVRLFHHTLW
jgi:hypothetical protein